MRRSTDSVADRYRRERPRLSDEVSRREKAAKILSVLSFFGYTDLSRWSCLDVGCGSGIVASALAEHFGKVTAVDLDELGVGFARSQYHRVNLSHVVGDATRLPIRTQTFDVVVCTHVYEHVSNAEALMGEVQRVVRPEGLVYFSGPNHLRLYEPHLRMWFVHWLPRPVTNAILSIVGRPPYEEHLRSHRSLLRLFDGFEVHDLNPLLVAHPERFHTSNEPGLAAARLLPPPIRDPLLSILAPSFNFLLTRRPSTAK